jgi:hypothetical protein
MRRSFPRNSLLALLFAIAFCLPPAHAEKKMLPAVRWTKGSSACEFHRDDDGRYRWRMTSDDLDLTLLIDSQELSKSRRRFYHVFGVYISVNYTGQGKFEFPADLQLIFLRHHNVTEGYMEPTEFQNKLQNDIDTVIFDTERQIKKHPEQAEEKNKLLREYQKEASEFIEFLSTQSLEPMTLTPGNPEVHGWVFFDTSNKWIGPWKPREDFLLRVWMKDKVWEFPFSLPPTEGDVILRKREE